MLSKVKKNIRKVLSSILIVMPVMCMGQEYRTSSNDIVETCASEKLSMVRSLLGCCGHIGSGSEVSDPSRALQEIDVSLSGDCLDGDPEAGSLLRLNRVAAYLEKSRLSAMSDNSQERKMSPEDAKNAVAEANQFVKDDPSASRRHWRWIIAAYRRAGALHEALRFVNELEYDADLNDRIKIELNAARGDLFVAMSSPFVAAIYYSRWVKQVNGYELCGRSESIENMKILTKQRYVIEGYDQLPKPEVVCLDMGWSPFV